MFCVHAEAPRSCVGDVVRHVEVVGEGLIPSMSSRGFRVGAGKKEKHLRSKYVFWRFWNVTEDFAGLAPLRLMKSWPMSHGWGDMDLAARRLWKDIWGCDFVRGQTWRLHGGAMYCMHTWEMSTRAVRVRDVGEQEGNVLWWAGRPRRSE